MTSCGTLLSRLIRRGVTPLAQPFNLQRLAVVLVMRLRLTRSLTGRAGVGTHQPTGPDRVGDDLVRSRLLRVGELEPLHVGLVGTRRTATAPVRITRTGHRGRRMASGHDGAGLTRAGAVAATAAREVATTRQEVSAARLARLQDEVFRSRLIMFTLRYARPADYVNYAIRIGNIPLIIRLARKIGHILNASVCSHGNHPTFSYCGGHSAIVSIGTFVCLLSFSAT